jgi:hypothetical protein
MSSITRPPRVAIVVALAALMVLWWTSTSGAAAPPDVCLEVSVDGLPEGTWDTVVAAVGDVVAARPALFPDPVLTVEPAAGDESTLAPTARIDIDAGHAAPPPDGPADATSTGCLLPGLDWSARYGRSFLEASADLMLQEAPTTPGVASDVVLEWSPDERRVRTLLTFAGPFDIPNGRCWVDDTLSIDPAAGLAVASGDQGLETSPFAEGACGRFFDYLPDGGAGEQAVTLLPAEVLLDAGGSVAFVATIVTVEGDAIVVGGSIDLRTP